MGRKRYFVPSVLILGLSTAVGAGFLTFRSGGTVQAATEPDKEIVLTIGETDRSALAEGDSLRKSYKFREAIAAYQKLLNTQGLALSLREEAEYNIGLSHTWLGEYDAAEVVFTRMLDTYRDDPNAVGYAEYCMAWIEVQRGKSREAISRLEESLAKGNITDRELAARTQFLIGRTYLMFLDNPVSARISFKKVLDTYPGTRIAAHPFVIALKGK